VSAQEIVEDEGLSFSSRDWFRNIRNIPQSRILRQIRSHLIANTGWAIVIAVVHGITPSHIIDDMHISTVPHAIMASALALLLVFRNNAAYDRYWEARKVWGSCTNSSRSLARLALRTFEGVESKELFLEYLKAYPFMLKQRLHRIPNEDEMMFLKLSEDEIASMVLAPSPPQFVAQRLTQVLATEFSPDESRFDVHRAYYRTLMEQEIVHLVDQLGMCERIMGTPVPRSYSLHTSRLLSIYLFTLPPVLVPHTEWYTPFVVCAICWGLLGKKRLSAILYIFIFSLILSTPSLVFLFVPAIEAIAYDIEEPFASGSGKSRLPIEKYAARIRLDIERMHLLEQMPPPRLEVRESSTETLSSFMQRYQGSTISQETDEVGTRE
jgi:putative membrane protein